MSLPHMVYAKCKDGLFEADDQGRAILGTLIYHTVVYDRNLAENAFYISVEKPSPTSNDIRLRHVKGEIVDWPSLLAKVDT